MTLRELLQQANRAGSCHFHNVFYDRVGLYHYERYIEQLLNLAPTQSDDLTIWLQCITDDDQEYWVEPKARGFSLYTDVELRYLDNWDIEFRPVSTIIDLPVDPMTYWRTNTGPGLQKRPMSNEEMLAHILDEIGIFSGRKID